MQVQGIGVHSADCGAGCPAASATLALGSIIAAIWIQDTGSFDTVWMCFGLNGFLFIIHSLAVASQVIEHTLFNKYKCESAVNAFSEYIFF